MPQMYVKMLRVTTIFEAVFIKVHSQEIAQQIQNGDCSMISYGDNPDSILAIDIYGDNHDDILATVDKQDIKLVSKTERLQKPE